MNVKLIMRFNVKQNQKHLDSLLYKVVYNAVTHNYLNLQQESYMNECAEFMLVEKRLMLLLLLFFFVINFKIKIFWTLSNKLFKIFFSLYF